MSVPSLPNVHGDAASARSRQSSRSRYTEYEDEGVQGIDAAAVETLQYSDPGVLEELRRAKEISLNCLGKQERTPRFRRFVNGEKLDRFLLAALVRTVSRCPRETRAAPPAKGPIHLVVGPPH